MAEHENDRFIPDTVDDQIDSSLAAQPATQPTDADADAGALDRQLIQALQRHYAPGSDANQPVERVWHRLAHHRASLRSAPNDEANWNRWQPENFAQPTGRNRLKPALNISHPYHTPFRRLGMVAAVVCAILLVGSMFAFYRLAQQASVNGRPTSTPIPHKQPTSTPNKHPAPTNADQVYAIVNSTVYRYDAATHQQLWSFSMPVPVNGAENIGATPLVMGNVLYTLGTGSDGYYSYAINTSDGSLRWRSKVPYQSQDLSLVGGQLVANGRVYLSEGSASQGYSLIIALDASTGTLVWQHRYNGTGISTRDHYIDASSGLPLVAATHTVLYGTTFTGKGNTTLYAISAANGSILWQKAVSTNGAQPDVFSESEVVVDGVLCITASFYSKPGSGHLYGFDAATGAARWSVPLDGQASPITASNGIVYLGSTNYQTTSDYTTYIASSSLYAVRASDGALLWRYKAQAGVSTPVVQNGIVAISVSRQDTTNQQTIVALDATNGNIRWTRTTSYQFAPTQVLASKNALYINTYGGQVQVVRISNGKLMDTFSVPAPVYPSASYYVDMTVVSYV